MNIQPPTKYTYKVVTNGTLYAVYNVEMSMYFTEPTENKAEQEKICGDFNRKAEAKQGQWREVSYPTLAGMPMAEMEGK